MRAIVFLWLLVAVLIALMLGFMGYMTYESHRRICVPGFTDCGSPPGAQR